MANNNVDDWVDVPLEGGVDDWEDVDDGIAAATLAADEAGPQEPGADISPVEALAMGSGDIASFGNLDEIGGGLKSLFGEGSYEENRDKIRARMKESRKQNPKSTFTGQLLTGGAMSAVPGLGLASGASKAAKASSLLGQGALYGQGSSEEEDIIGQAKDAVVSGGLNLAGGVLGAGVGAGIGKAARATGRGLKKGSKAAFGYAADLPEDVVEGILKDPKAFKDAKNIEGMTDHLIENMKALRDKIRVGDYKAMSVLTGDKVDVKPIVSRMMKYMKTKDLLVSTEGGSFIPSSINKKSYNAVNDALQEIDLRDPSERNMKKLIRSIDASINWDKPELQTTNEALKFLRTSIDTALKKQNPEYGLAMKPLARNVELLEKASKAFKIDRFMNTSDTTASKLKNLRMDVVKRESLKPETQKVVEKLDPNMMKNLEYSRLSDLGKQQTTTGARKTLMGAALGSPFGPIGAAAGAGVGFVMDKSGRKIGTNALLKMAESREGFNRFLSDQLGLKATPKVSEFLRKALMTGGATSFMVSKDQLIKNGVISQDNK
jgi:hypothetical protein